MKSFNRLRLAVIGLGLALAAASSASAQNVAADLIRKAMAGNGVTSGFSVRSKTAYPEYVGWGNLLEFKGLRLNSAVAEADSGPGWAFISIVENLSDRPYCIRPKTEDLPSGQIYNVQTVNQIVEPGKTLMIVGITDPGYVPTFYAQVRFAYWPPNYDAPNTAWCRSNAPDGLQDWLASSDIDWFDGSRKD